MDYTYYDLGAVPSAGNIIVHLVDVQTSCIFIGVESESFNKLDYTTLIISQRLMCISLVPNYNVGLLDFRWAMLPGRDVGKVVA